MARQVIEAIGRRDGDGYYALFSQRCRRLAEGRDFFREQVAAVEAVGGGGAILRARRLEADMEGPDRATVRWSLIVLTADRRAVDAGPLDDAPSHYVNEDGRWRIDTC